MKKVVIAIGVCLILITGFLLLPLSSSEKDVNATYLRVHIRANSNSETDQSIKYEIKGILVEYLTPRLQNVTSLNDAKKIVGGELENLSCIATKYLKEKGFSYVAKAKLNTEYFPTRSYEEITLADGFYDALIVELGEAKGNNWWCVVYPPLCFNENSGDDKVVYSSIIKEIIEGNREEK